jgi:hypothetical protein
MIVAILMNSGVAILRVEIFLTAEDVFSPETYSHLIS